MSKDGVRGGRGRVMRNIAVGGSGGHDCGCCGVEEEGYRWVRCGSGLKK